MVKWNEEYKVYVSDDGQVFSTRIGKCKLEYLGNGYARWSTNRNHKKIRILVHRLVWETFRWKIPAGMEIDHINRNKIDNRLSNLRCVNHTQNMKNWIAPEQYPRTEFGIKFKEHFGIQMCKDRKLYLREYRYYKKYGKCSWE